MVAAARPQYETPLRVSLGVSLRSVRIEESSEMRAWRRITAWLLWLSYAGLYFIALFGVPFFGSAMPIFMAVPLLVVAVLFASIYWPVRPRLAVIIPAVATGNLVVALLLVGGPGTEWSLAGWRWTDPPGLPKGVLAAAVIVGLVIPLCVTVTVIRALRRDRTTLIVESAD